MGKMKIGNKIDCETTPNFINLILKRHTKVLHII